MIYQVQNAGGDVYGQWPLPDEPALTADDWAAELHAQLADIEGANGILATRFLMDSRTGETVDRVVVDIEPWHRTRRVSTLDDEVRLEQVHRTVGMIARGETPEVPAQQKGSRIGRFISKVTGRSN